MKASSRVWFVAVSMVIGISQPPGAGAGETQGARRQAGAARPQPPGVRRSSSRRSGSKRPQAANIR